MQVIRHIHDLTAGELGRIRTTLRSRFQMVRQSNLLEIGFGRAEKGGVVDPNRQDAACFYVRTKQPPQEKDLRIPRLVEVRVKRKSHYVLVRLPTDLLAAESLQLSGRAIQHTSGPRQATAGCVVAWRVASQGRGNRGGLEWGVLTVGHLFTHPGSTPEAERNVRIAASDGGQMHGQLLARSQRTSGGLVDAALVRVARESLEQSGLLAPNRSTRGKKIYSATELLHAPGRSGITLPERYRIGFVVLRYLPVSTLVPVLGPLAHVLDVRSDLAGTFAGGRSGSLWMIGRQAACMQFGGWETPGRPSLSYRRGLGQSLEPILDWAKGRVARIEQIPPSHVDMRLVQEL